MGERKELKIPKKFIDKYEKVNLIWSYSKLNTFNQCTYEYYLSRIMKYKSEDNIYSLSGTVAHDILEDYYNNKIKYENMLDRFDRDFLIVEMSDFKFSSDVEKNLKMRNKYKECISHFFKHHIPVNHKVLTERQVWIDIEGNIFIGYIDAIHKENNIYIITDYKTSSITEYKGDKLKEKQKQLLLYALGLNQLGISLDNIEVRWNFLKYTIIKYKHKINVTYKKNNKLTTSCLNIDDWVNSIKTQLKKDIKEFYDNKNTKEIKAMLDNCIAENSLQSLDESIQQKYKIEECFKIGDRNNWVNSIKTQLKKDIKEHYNNLEEFEIDIKVADCIRENSLQSLDKLIQENYMLEDCYIYGEVNEETISDLKNNIIEDINNIISKGKEEENWKRESINKNEEYYCNVLCGVRKICPYYKEYLKTLNESYQEESDLIKELESL